LKLVAQKNAAIIHYISQSIERSIMKTKPFSILHFQLSIFNYPLSIKEFLWLAAILLIITPGCNKEPDRLQGTIHGKVLDKVTLEPVVNAKILFRIRDKCHFIEEEFCWTTIDSTSYYTDSLGKFKIDYDIHGVQKSSNPFYLGARPVKDGYFYLSVDGHGGFRPGIDSITIVLWPKTYLRVRILDETRDHRKYDGIRLRHAGALPFDSIMQRPLDTTIIITGDPFYFPSHGYNTLRWNLFYLDNPGIIGPIQTIPQVQCPPHDTCDIEIRF